MDLSLNRVRIFFFSFFILLLKIYLYRFIYDLQKRISNISLIKLCFHSIPKMKFAKILNLFSYAVPIKFRLSISWAFAQISVHSSQLTLSISSLACIIYWLEKGRVIKLPHDTHKKKPIHAPFSDIALWTEQILFKNRV